MKGYMSKKQSKTKKTAKTSKKTTKAKAIEPVQAPEPTIGPLENLTYEEFDKLRNQLGDNEVFEMYDDEIQDYAEWLWREQDRGGPMYDLDQCIERAKESLIDGIWGPYAD
jgi:hypothetical protein